MLPDLCKLISSEFSPLIRHVLDAIKLLLEKLEVEAIIPEIENIIFSLASYVSSPQKNPEDTVTSAANLLKSALDKLYAGEYNTWIRTVPTVCNSIAGLLSGEGSMASQASVLMKDLINNHISWKPVLNDQNELFYVDGCRSELKNVIASICSTFDKILGSSDGIPREHILEVLSVLFQKLGKSSYIFMKGILLKLAAVMTLAHGDASEANCLRCCIGSAIFSMGPEKILMFLPISLCDDDLTNSNIWLVPILKDYVVGSSLGYYMEHIMPLAKSFKRASLKAKKSVSSRDLQVHSCNIWGLLPAFCRYPTDTHKNFGTLAEHLVKLLKKHSDMHENVAIALQVLVRQNKSLLRSEGDAGELDTFFMGSVLEFRGLPSYSKKTATRNIKALASCSYELLQTLVDIFFHSAPAMHTYIEDAIGCLTSIMDSSVNKKVFTSFLEKSKIMCGEDKFGKDVNISSNSINVEHGCQKSRDKDAQRCVILKLASAFIEGAKEDLVELIYGLIKHTFQTDDNTGYHEAYETLGRILQRHAWFCSARFVELIELLFTLKPPADVASLRSRLACLHLLLPPTLKMPSEDESVKAFLILNEIILTLKDAKEERRKAAYDTLLKISTCMKNLPPPGSDGPYYKLTNMVMGYLSGSSPHIKSGAVSALSVFVYDDPDICLLVPDLVSSLLSLLQSKAMEVIKAVLGFVKVLVSSLQPQDLQSHLSDVISAILPWSAVSKFHFRSKITIILEILARRCGTVGVKSVTPEKYKGFIKTVLENRKGKSSSKERVANSTDIIPVESTVKRPWKAMHKELENGLGKHQKRKREESESGSIPISSEHNMSDTDSRIKRVKRAGHCKRSVKSQSEEHGVRKGNNFKKGHFNGRKKKMGQAYTGQKKGGVGKGSSRVQKHKKGQRK